MPVRAGPIPPLEVRQNQIIGYRNLVHHIPDSVTGDQLHPAVRGWRMK